MNLDQIKELIRRERQASTLFPSAHDQGLWNWEGTRLVNSQANFFQIIDLESNGVGRQFKVVQENGAQVMLAFREDDNGGREFLLQLRAEPGLVGRVCLTATIQSTNENLSALHGGKLPDLAALHHNPLAYGHVVQESRQWDWQDLYINKEKTFRIVRLREIPPNSAVHFWVPESLMGSLAMIPCALSADLLCALGLLWGEDYLEGRMRTFTMGSPDFGTSSVQIPPLILHEMELEVFSKPIRTDSRGHGINFVRFSSGIREVRSWIQPLLDVPVIRDISLELGGEFANPIISGSYGDDTLEHQVPWRDSPITGSPTASPATRRVYVSAEGGRFSRHLAIVSIIDGNPIDASSRISSHHTELRSLIGQAREGLSTSVSQRLALFGVLLRLGAKKLKLEDASPP